MKLLKKYSALALLSAVVGCGEDRAFTRADTPEQCINEKIYLNLNEGIRISCGEVRRKFESFRQGIENDQTITEAVSDEEPPILGMKCLTDLDLPDDHEIRIHRQGSGLLDRDEEARRILEAVRCYYEPMHIKIYGERPLEYLYNETVVTGEVPLLCEDLADVSSCNGLAAGWTILDIGNRSHDAFAVVASATRVMDGNGFLPSVPIVGASLLHVILHETGHFLGLQHIGEGYMSSRESFFSLDNPFLLSLSGAQGDVLAQGQRYNCPIQEGLITEDEIASLATSFGDRCVVAIDAVPNFNRWVDPLN